MRSVVSFLDWICLKCFVDRGIERHKVRIQETHRRKLSNLGANNSISPLDPNQVIFNFSSRSLTSKEKNLLAYGLNFNLPIFKLDFFNFFLSFERLYRILKDKPIYNSNQQPSLKSILHNLAFRVFYNFKPYKVFSPIFNKNDIKTLQNLSRDKSIVICRPDKGRGIVLLDKTEYINKMNTILEAPDKFQLIDSDNWLVHTLRQEDKVNRVINKFKREGIIPESLAHTLTVSGTNPGTMYGLPKVHKQNYPLRPILSANNTPTYNLAKFLVPLLNPYTTNNYSLKNSFDFVDTICNIPNANRYTMCSYDVTSLFTQIPLKETINICLDKIFSNNTSIFHGFNRVQFKSLLELAICNSYFIFNNKLYKQIDGVAMGSPLAPTLANLFLSHWEQIWLNTCPNNCKPTFFKRYVDDTFVLFDSPEKPLHFLEFLNSQHNNIKFTIEQEQNKSLPFLDTTITIKNNNFESSIYRKPTFTGLGTHFLSHTQLIYKINSIKTLIYRSFQISSNYLNFHTDIVFLKNFFLENGYPTNLF